MPRKSFMSLNPGFTHFKRGLDTINKTIWPSVFGLDRLRVAVRDFREDKPSALNVDIGEAVSAGATIPIQMDLTRFEDDFSKLDQESLIGQLALFGLTAHLEGALQSACSATGLSSKELMFPPSAEEWNDPARWGDMRPSWSKLRSGSSSLISANYQKSYESSVHFAESRIPALEEGFRYWKEARNALIHAGGLADDKFITAQTAYSDIKRTDLGLRTKVMLSTDGHVSGSPGQSKLLKKGDPIVISPYAAFNAADIMLKLAHTLDYLIARTPAGEKALLDRLDSVVDVVRWNDPQYRSMQTIRRFTAEINAPLPANPQSILDALTTRRNQTP